jgi:hypothetical protein
MGRKAIARERLRGIIEREFRDTAGDSCLKCTIPMPAYLEPGESDAPNWRIGRIDECSTLCHSILEDIAAKLAREYDITRPRQ